jgi:hypothetical protein
MFVPFLSAVPPADKGSYPYKDLGSCFICIANRPVAIIGERAPCPIYRSKR